MTFDQLWNGWRSEYVQSVPTAAAVDDHRSVFVRLLESGLDDIQLNIIHRGRQAFVILNAFPYATGHLLVLPYRQIADLEDLTPEEHTEIWDLVTRAVEVVKDEYRPDGINIGLNLGRPAGGSISEHLHVHIVPRWIGDSNFMTAVANTRTIPEALVDTAGRLRRRWDRSTPSGPRLEP